MAVDEPRSGFKSAIAAHADHRAPRPYFNLSENRLWLWLVLMFVGVAFAVLTIAFWGQPGGRTVLEPPASRASDVAQPVPADELPPAEPPLPGPASMAPPVPTGPTASAGVPALAPPKQPPKQPTKPNPPAPAPLFSALAGFRCPDTATSGYTQRVGSSGWYLVTGGGWTGDGCQGHLIAMPMSGDPNQDDLNNVILWWFKVPSRPKCAVEVYVPHGPSLRDAAGAPATYFVYGTTDGSGSVIGRFDIDQIPNQGRWVGVGAFPATSGQLSVRMMSRGVSTVDNAHLGGSAVRISC